MMRPRLEAGRRVLADTGAIFVSIDDNEVAHLRLLLDEVYGEPNFLAQIVVNLNPKGRQLGERLRDVARVPPRLRQGRAAVRARRVERRPGRRGGLPAGDRRRAPLPAAAAAQHQQEVQPADRADAALRDLGRPRDRARSGPSPFDGAVEIKPVFGDGSPAVWRWSRPRIDERPDDLVCRWVRGTAGDRIDVFQRDWLGAHDRRRRARKKLRTIWLAEEIGSTDTAVAELKEILGHVFESPKPTGLVRRILDTMPDDARVLDYFAGSGTTGHAVALANAADGGRRTCLSVNHSEPVRPGSNADLAGYRTVADITRARLRAVAERVGGGYAESAAG